MGAPPIACDLSVFDATERIRHAELSRTLFAAVDTAVELSDGYEFTFGEAAYWEPAAAFVDFERRCCPFFNFDLSLLNSSVVRLRLTGPEGAKTLVQVELLPLVAAGHHGAASATHNDL